MIDLDAFRDAVTAFMREHARPRGGKEAAAPIAEARRFQRALSDAGLAGLTWPLEAGGRGLGREHQRAFDTVAQEFDVPTSDLTIALNVCGPAVAEFGDDEQRGRHCRATLRGEQVWCQLWSEPDAGSDLAAVRTRADRDEDGAWVIHGHKIWTSVAQIADFAILLARTQPHASKHKGLSMFVVPMDSPGIRVEPLRQITGEAEFNEVWLDGVRLPADALLGEDGDGWRVLTWMMGRERISVGVTMRSSNTLQWEQVRDMAADRGLLDDPEVASRLVSLRSLYRGAEALRLRIAQEVDAGQSPPTLGSATKLVEAQFIADAAELAAFITGQDSTAWLPDSPGGAEADSPGGAEAAAALLKAPAFSIGGGTTEIQLNTLAEQVLKLPREPRPS
ncbi:acyl-CoA dehydrogenase family protein [Streptosporangium sp. NPDC051022]|uniref:acyl-CoA dehydrogenase family protein n=1 Tax=Streptosporangium sp. NPDC051022 TaxID=3155752 RepID=UPI003438BC4B